jgi:glyoxylase-like metal-dependent hydrolase (beta-lactamase superfamily II)
MPTGTPGWMIDADGILIRRLRVGDLENNVYVVACKATGDAILIDASFEPDRIEAACVDVTVGQILLSHGHWDHLAAAPEVRARLEAPLRIHDADVRPDLCHVAVDGYLIDRQRITIGEVEVEVVHTPGHTPGSVTFLVGDHAITGDTLFPGGPGATRWDYSSFEQIIDSIVTRLFTLDEAVGVYPGHGDAMTTIGAERPELQDWIERGW